MSTETEFQVNGKSANALFTLKLHRGEGMVLIAMNWKTETPPRDFVGFCIEYKEPGGNRFFAIRNRLSFPGNIETDKGVKLSTRLSPIQKFRWIHFPRNAEIFGEFVYRVYPVFMNTPGKLSYGDHQEASVALHRETYPNHMNVSFTRGFVSSQAFTDRYVDSGPISTLLPEKAKCGLNFQPTHLKTKEALTWMGFEARSMLIEILDRAIKDSNAKISMIAYDLNEPEIVERLKLLGKRLKLIIDDDGEHGKIDSAEKQAEDQLRSKDAKVKRQHMGKLQHNKIIIVNGLTLKAVVCGSTNFSWRGLYVQNNNAILLTGDSAMKVFETAFNQYWIDGSTTDFGNSPSAQWQPLGLTGIDASVTFSPHIKSNSVLDDVGADIAKAKSSLFYSMAFLSQTSGPVRQALTNITLNDQIFVYGMSDKRTGGFELLTPDGNIAPISPATLGENAPEPFRSELTGGGGTRIHHKFIVIDFDKPTARVYMGSYNFSFAADKSNGENLLLIKNRKVAVAYMIEALRMFDHYHFRLSVKKSVESGRKLTLKPSPTKDEDQPWWFEHYNNVRKIKDRLLFA